MNKTYAITGVATGIGAEVARLLKKDGHRIIGFDIEDGADNVDQLIHLDLGDSNSIDAAIAKLNEPLDGLCNNAGIPPRDGTEAAILKVNFLGQRQFTNQILNKLNTGSAIVNMASRAGHGWRENIDQVLRLGKLQRVEDAQSFVANEKIDPTRAYNLSKEAILLWTMSETDTLISRNLRMNSVSPGAVSTAILDDFAWAFGEKMVRNVARAGRPSTPEDVANAVVFLLSNQSTWLKGIDLPVDGGMGASLASEMLGLDALSFLQKTDA